MCDWWLSNRRKLPKAISAFQNWLNNTKPDETLKAERLAELKHEANRKQIEERRNLIRTSIPVDKKILDDIRKKIGRPI